MYPKRIVCLAAEVPEILYEVGALDRVVAISAYTKRPQEALHLPKASGFRYGNIERIMSFQPDLVILTSNVQRELSGQLIQKGVPVFHLNPHRFEDIFTSIVMLGGLVGCNEQAEKYAARLQQRVADIQEIGARLKRRPRVYFEEWNDPLIAGTAWVSDLIELAGGRDVFRQASLQSRQVESRTVTPEDVIQADPDLILASWCGKPVRVDDFYSRPGWESISAVQQGQIYELDSTVLQAGPMLLSSLEEMAGLFEKFDRQHQTGMPAR